MCEVAGYCGEAAGEAGEAAGKLSSLHMPRVFGPFPGELGALESGKFLVA